MVRQIDLSSKNVSSSSSKSLKSKYKATSYVIRLRLKLKLTLCITLGLCLVLATLGLGKWHMSAVYAASCDTHGGLIPDLQTVVPQHLQAHQRPSKGGFEI